MFFTTDILIYANMIIVLLLCASRSCMKLSNSQDITVLNNVYLGATDPKTDKLVVQNILYGQRHAKCADMPKMRRCIRAFSFRLYTLQYPMILLVDS